MRLRYTLLLFTAVFGLMLSGYTYRDSLRSIDNNSFKQGEVLHYKVHYGVVNAGEATIDISSKIHRVNNRPCYLATVSGRSTGSFDFFHRIRDTWSSYIDTTSILPMRFHRNIEEGRYRRKETTEFDHYRNTVIVNDSRDEKKNQVFKVPDNVQDMVSGFYFLRTLNLNEYKPGQNFNVQGFLGDDIFNLNVTYKGKEVIETKAGKIRVHRLVPRMPKNKLFDGEDAISVYFSDDLNKVPVMFKAEMFVGAVKVDLYKYSGLQHKVAVVR